MSYFLKGKSFWLIDNKRIFKIKILKILCISTIIFTLGFYFWDPTLFASLRSSDNEVSQSSLTQFAAIIFNVLCLPLYFIVQCTISDEDKSKNYLQIALLIASFSSSTGLNGILKFLIGIIFFLSYRLSFAIIFSKRALKKLFKFLLVRKKIKLLLVTFFTMFLIFSLSFNSLLKYGLERKTNEIVTNEFFLEQVEKIVPALITRVNVDNVSVSVHSLGAEKLECIEGYNTINQTIGVTLFRIEKVFNRLHGSKNSFFINEPKSTARMNILAVSNCETIPIGEKEGTSISPMALIIRMLKQNPPFGLLTTLIVWYLVIRWFWFVTGRYLSNIYYSGNIVAFLIASCSGIFIGYMSIDNLLLLLDESILVTILLIYFRSIVIPPVKL